MSIQRVRDPLALPPHPSAAGRRAFSQSAARHNYEATIQNLAIHKDTKVLCQGFTGKTASRGSCESSIATK